MNRKDTIYTPAGQRISQVTVFPNGSFTRDPLDETTSPADEPFFEDGDQFFFDSESGNTLRRIQHVGYLDRPGFGNYYYVFE